MASLKEVRNRIRSVISTQQITKAMKMVAASKLRKAQDQIMQLRPYAEKLEEILINVVGATESSESSIFGEEREIKGVLIIAVTSDRGLCGAFNSNVLKRVSHLAQNEFADIQADGKLEVMPVGKKAYDFIRKNQFNAVNDFWEVFHELSFDTVRLAAEYAMNGFTSGKYDVVVIVYNEFKNVASQVLRTEQFLPIVTEDLEKDSSHEIDYIFEPSEDYIVQELIPQSLKIKFYKAILESYASEHGARMTAMDQATENADEILSELKITYNRTRQAAITKEILEIVGGADALSQS